MLRAALKGALLCGFGWAPSGARFYRTLTRDWMGTQATHVDKLRRVWPGYERTWRELCGLELEGLEMWIHEGGWTPFPTLAMHLATGRGGAVTNREAHVLDRYLARAVNGVLDLPSPPDDPFAERRARIEPLRWSSSAREAIAALGGALHEQVDVASIPLASSSVDLCHSGGALEHLTPDALAAFLRECLRVLKPGGVASHVLDHRDHLHHADGRWPYLAHLGFGDASYRLLFGHALGYHSRLLPAEVTRLFEAIGFYLYRKPR